ncbi:type I restriction-modification system subunit M [Companilactobacillus sp.]|jgi:type I restriction enzyme M protein|uniref:type I restriction-modification system subunit M n=1 Tax=Companilactobacillus sp. TaxID=2767905 RepID=UPI0025BEF63E|nr:type I restriction-modification system subunit M [Companilactobacillus sp.]MCH4010028.1 type I restriction-modification system subunit M [Companilactobacillus sp.]MCH4052296.1 type I restriction-modification system subunit M [Companilactobacillus sp.]MCH4077970.1 type I restriction-modification system subunit M [Companilactobacillus sp.]MCH4126546.1 type I restriction-modification system subunit M [Companilactobacillus sp.]MCH4132132.1 type I restriction-modification system subunit M [Compa
MSKAQEITSQIWEMANKLRSNMDASEYRNYILGFMFYRYLSEHQAERMVQNDLIQVEEGQSINDAYIEQAGGDDLNDYLEELADSLGYAIAPQYTWQTIVDKVNNNSIAPSDFQDMLDDFNHNVDLNTHAKQDFHGVFADMNLGNSRLGQTTAARAKALTEIVNLVDEVEYKDDDGHDILGDIYEYLIAQFAGNSGKKAGEFYTPHQVSEVLAKLVAIGLDSDEDKPSVYDFACGSGSLLLTVQEQIKDRRLFYYGQELNTTTYNLARMNLMMHDVSYMNMDLRNADTLESDWPDGVDAQGIDHPRNFDMVVANPPYSARWDNNDNKMKDARFKDYGGLAPKTKADYAFLLHGLYHLSNRGTMAIVLPHGVLFRGAKEEKIRRALLGKNQIDAVIGLPAGLFYSTGIPTVVMVLKKNKTNKDVLFIDASSNFEKGKNQNILRDGDINKIIDTYKERKDVDKYAHVATIDEINENDFNLNIPRYVDTFEPEPEIDLGELTKNIKENNKKIEENKKELLSMMKELTSSDEKIQNDLNDFINMLNDEVNHNG